jgi:acyl-coenzyme A thioesterase PaaI-like protein
VTVPESLLPPERLPSHTTTCMGCGPDNPHGLRLVVHRSGDAVYTDVTFDERHIGAPGLAHGGAVAAACDDVLGFTLWIAGTPAVTRTLTVEYLRPVPLHQTHRITAHIVSREGRALHVTATGTGEVGSPASPPVQCSLSSALSTSPHTAMSALSAIFWSSSRAAAASTRSRHDCPSGAQPRENPAFGSELGRCREASR